MHISFTMSIKFETNHYLFAFLSNILNKFIFITVIAGDERGPNGAPLILGHAGSRGVIGHTAVFVVLSRQSPSAWPRALLRRPARAIRMTRSMPSFRVSRLARHCDTSF